MPRFLACLLAALAAGGLLPVASSMRHKLKLLEVRAGRYKFNSTSQQWERSSDGQATGQESPKSAAKAATSPPSYLQRTRWRMPFQNSGRAKAVRSTEEGEEGEEDEGRKYDLIDTSPPAPEESEVILVDAETPTAQARLPNDELWWQQQQQAQEAAAASPLLRADFSGLTAAAAAAAAGGAEAGAAAAAPGGAASLAQRAASIQEPSAFLSGLAASARRLVPQHMVDSAPAAWAQGQLLHIVAYVFAFVLCIVSACAIRAGNFKSLQTGGMLRCLRDSVEQSRADSVSQIEGILLGVLESPAGLAEAAMGHARRDFQRFVGRIRKDPEQFAGRHGSEELLPAFLAFAKQWLSVYKQWSLDPLDERPLVEDSELEACSSLSEAAGLIDERLAIESRRQESAVAAPQPLRAKVAALRSAHCLDDDAREEHLLTFSAASGWGFGRRARPELHWEHQAERFPVDVSTGVVALTLLSPFHFLLCASFAFGVAALALEMASGRLHVALLLGVAQTGLLAMLSQIRGIDVSASLVQEVYALERAKQAVQSHLLEVEAFRANASSLEGLWALRTLPCLELLGQLHTQLGDTADKEKATLLVGASERLSKVFDSLGPLEFWLGQPTEMHHLAAEQLDACTDSIEALMDDEAAVPLALGRLERPFGFLALVLRGAQHLSQGVWQLGEAAPELNPYLIVAAGDQEPQRTKTVVAQPSPVWNEECSFPVHVDQPALDIHVWSDSGSSGTKDLHLGYLQIDLGVLTPDIWHTRRDHLLDGKKHIAKSSLLEYDMYFASEPRHLLQSVGESVAMMA